MARGRFAFERCVTGRCDCGHESLPSATERHVALTLATFADPNGSIPLRFSPSLTTLGKATGLHRATVVRALGTLEDEGWIERRQTLARSQNSYLLTSRTRRLVAEDDQSYTTTSRAERPPQVAHDDLTSRTERHIHAFQPLPAAAAQSTDEKEKPMVPDRLAEQLARVADLLDVADPAAVVDSWVAHRAAIGRPVASPAALLDRMPDDELRTQLSAHKPQRAPRPKCQTCDGLGRALDADGYPTRESCPDCNGSKYIDTDERQTA